MITKERLEELIEQKQPIYYKDYYIIYPSKWRYGYVIPEQLECLYKKPLNKLIWYDLTDLYGSKEERDWHIEFGDITRTETLKLPSWEEIYETANKEFYNLKDNMFFEIIGRRYPSYDERTIRLVKGYTKILFEKPLTKENYIEACRLCKKLFLGE